MIPLGLTSIKVICKPLELAKFEIVAAILLRHSAYRRRISTGKSEVLNQDPGAFRKNELVIFITKRHKIVQYYNY
jgi:hypothetical protein